MVVRPGVVVGTTEAVLGTTTVLVAAVTVVVVTCATERRPSRNSAE